VTSDTNIIETLSKAENQVFNNGRGEAIVNSQKYSSIPGEDGLRTLAEEIATDGLWRCANKLNVVNTK